MGWQTENAKDMQLLSLAGLTPLYTSVAAPDANLMGMVEMHNAHLARAVARLRQLAADRKRLANFDDWLRAESADIATAWCRVRRESWDALLGLRRVLEERQAILGQVALRLGERCNSLDQAHRAAVAAAAAEKRLHKQPRRMERSNFAMAGGDFADLVAGQRPVAQAAVREALESVSATRRALGRDLSALTARQREVFALMLV